MACRFRGLRVIFLLQESAVRSSVPGNAVGEAEVLVQESQSAALPADLQTFF